MSSVRDRLTIVTPDIEKIMKIGGAAGLALGVLHKGEPVYQANFGFRDIEKKLPPDADTIFACCSLMKALTSATIGLLVEENKVQWDALVMDVLPEFRTKEDVLHTQTTVADLLSHRTGMAWADNLYISTNNNVLISAEDSLKYLSHQEALLPFRGQFSYNNLGYEIAGHIISKLTGSYWSDLLHSEILDPLGLKRTLTKPPAAGVDNVAVAHTFLDDGTPYPIGPVQAGKDLFGGPSGGLRSSVNDLLKLYRSFLVAFNDQFKTGNTATEGSPLKQVRHLMSAKVPVNPPTRTETSYGYGWARVQLPATKGDIGCNPPLMLDGMPVVGKGIPSQLVLYHQGSLPGALTAVMLVPETETAIVVLTNSLALNDVPDWVGQLVLEAILDVPKDQRNDYVKATETSRATTEKWYATTTEELFREKKNDTSPRDLKEYVGTYWDPAHVFKIVVTEDSGKLYWAFQGLDSERFILNHYEDDVFTWIQTRNELVKRGRWVGQGPDFWKAEFRADKDGYIKKLFWVHGIGVSAVEHTKD
ncbi:beta-lactamase/transpeptidase-like protein [Aaosphaeria arxii CBS 175.79]|uniref:Beta-lactamase/transpeptidase-like protein n=1 Tax=Aaosphaeria arxii CBS 175.79 TaxID=1450172 RepID=A0A6A5XC65_9PLEO|nr:beta-lactamase/transpeptidase-like protein [Aaosphaeria arxii CBS 175.79]KAF2010510.1 beta-lactamase/transpeptidase-like protein [Aaosphaeria arxii CBS 175.79]